MKLKGCLNTKTVDPVVKSVPSEDILIITVVSITGGFSWLHRYGKDARDVAKSAGLLKKKISTCTFKKTYLEALRVHSVQPIK